MVGEIRKPSLRTYSRKAKQAKMDDVFYTEKAFKSQRSNSPFLNDKSISNEKKHGIQDVQEDYNGSVTIKKRKMKTVKAEQKKTTKKANVKKKPLKLKMASADKKDDSELYESLLTDEMFGDSTPYKKDGKAATKQVKSKNIPVGQKTTQLSNQSVETELPSQGSLPVTEMGVADKVSAWFARSTPCHTEAVYDDNDPVGDIDDDEDSIEQMRGEISSHGQERRQKLFTDEYFHSLQTIIQPHKKDKNREDMDRIQAEKEQFLSKLSISGPRTSSKCMGPERRENINIKDSTGTNSKYSIGLSSKTPPSQYNTGTMTVSQSNMASTDEETSTNLHSTEMDTRTSKYSTDIQTGSSSNWYTGTSSNKVSEMGTNTNKSQVKITSTGTKDRSAAQTKSVATSKKMGKDSRNSYFVDPKVMKYLCSTGKKGLKLSELEFPSEMSTIAETESMRRERINEKTPSRNPVFKIPDSPSKLHSNAEHRKRSLEPKTSTKLFSSEGLEVVDAFPQMSTIRCDEDIGHSITAEKVELVSSPTLGVIEGDQRPVKTSTPNKQGPQPGKLDFEMDISSVHIDSDDNDEGLHFNQSSREVNSQELINLSTTLIDLQKDQIPARLSKDSSSDEEKKKQSRGTTQPSSVVENVISENTCKQPIIRKTANKLKKANKVNTKNNKGRKTIVTKVNGKYDIDLSAQEVPTKKDNVNKLKKPRNSSYRQQLRTDRSKKKLEKVVENQNMVSKRRENGKNKWTNRVSLEMSDPKKQLMFSNVTNSHCDNVKEFVYENVTEISVKAKNKETKLVSKKINISKKVMANAAIKDKYESENLYNYNFTTPNNVCSLMNERFSCARVGQTILQKFKTEHVAVREIVDDFIVHVPPPAQAKLIGILFTTIRYETSHDEGHT